MSLKNKAVKLIAQPAKFFADSWVNDVVSGKKVKPCFDFIGSNWSDEKSKKPIAILWGFNPWKREQISNFFSEYRTAFVFGNSSWLRAKKNLELFPEGEDYVFISWAYKAPKAAENYAKDKGYKFLRIEDGFLRSCNPGLKHTKALSLAVDDEGLYFDATTPSRLESLIKNHDFKKDKSLMADAKKAIDVFKALKLSKYYSLVDQDNPQKLNRDLERERKRKEEGVLYKSLSSNSSYAILVLGQVEDDNSIKFGSEKYSKNSEVIKKAHEDYPEAEIYFRPHPDVLHGNRRERSKIRKLSNICTIVDEKIPLTDLFNEVDHIYTITSLSGFEALLHGKKVTTLGAPFYSGWSLTDEKQEVERRGEERNLEQIFAASYLLYPKYIHPVNDEEIDFFELASYFFIEKVKFLDIYNIPKRYADVEKLEKYKSKLSVPALLLFYLKSTNYLGEGDSGEIFKIIKGSKNKPFNLKDFSQISQLLINTCNYDSLKEYCDYCLEYLAKNFAELSKNKELLNNFFYALNTCLKNANGRAINDIPDLSEFILGNIDFSHGLSVDLLLNYSRAISSNIQYDILEKLVNKLCGFINSSLPHNVLQKLCAITAQKPTRSERNDAKRNELLLKTGAKYKEVLNQKFDDNYDLFINSALYGVAIQDKNIVLNAYKKHLAMFDEDEFNFSMDNFGKLGQLSKRKKDFFYTCNYLLKVGEVEFTTKMLETFEDKETKAQLNGLVLAHHLKVGDYDKYIHKYNSLLIDERNEQGKLYGYIKCLKAGGEFQKAIEILETYKSRQITPDKRSAIEMEINKLNFVKKASEIIDSYPQPKLPKGVVFIASQTCYNSMALLTPALLEAKKMGYAVINLTEGMLSHSNTGLEFIDKFANSIPLSFHFDKIENDWVVNWEKKLVESDGINFYQGFYERLSTQFRKFFVDINERALNNDFNASLKRADKILSVCKAIYKEIVLDKKLPVAFISGNNHVTPFSIVRDFCRAKNHELLTFVNANVSYESYFTNVGSKFSSTMALSDMTVQPFRRAPFLADKDEFEVWYNKNKNNKEIIKKAESLIKIDRVKTGQDSKEQEILKEIEGVKKAGKKIVCVMGKLPVDLGVPFDGGPAHLDMADWLNHTVEIFNGLDNALLLIKPHPHEMRPDIGMDLVTPFTSLIDVEVGKNIKILGHKDINSHALAPHLDLAIMWNGSSGVELTAQGIPTVMCSYFGKYDYPVEMLYPESRDQYEEFISGYDYQKPDDETRKRAAFSICYLGTDEITIINQYATRQVTNDKMGVPKWNEEKVHNLINNGDGEMKRAAEKIVQKFEPLYSKEIEINKKKKSAKEKTDENGKKIKLAV